MKIKYLNGIKGLCCIQVSLGHMIALLIPAMYFGGTYNNHSEIEIIIQQSPIAMLWNASSALCCFLIISGFVIPYTCLQNTQKTKVLGKVIQRYFRFLPMALIGVFLGWVIMKFDFVYSYKITDLSYSYGYAGIYNNFSVNGIFSKDGPLVEALIKVFLTSSATNNPLGTLKYILWIGCLLYFLIKYLNGFKYRDIVYGFLVMISFVAGFLLEFEMYYVAAMLSGTWHCDLIYNARCNQQEKESKKLYVLAFIFSICCISVPWGISNSGIYSWVPGGTQPIFWILGWNGIIYSISNLHIIRTFLESKIIQKLGDISFAYYVVHWPLAISFTCFITKQLHLIVGVPYIIAAMLSIFISIPVIIVFAFMVQKFLYTPVRKWIDKKLLELKVI